MPETNSEGRVAAVAALFSDVRHGKRPNAPIPAELVPQSEDEAYAIQRRVTNNLGDTIAGWKTAITATGESNYGPIVTAFSHSSLARIALDFRRGVLVEIEICYILGRDLPQRTAPYSEADVRAAVERVAIGIEIVHSRLPVLEGAPPLCALADNMSNGAYALGGSIAYSAAPDLSAVPFTMTLDGKEIRSGRTKHPKGDPIAPLLLMANSVGDHLGGLRKGQYVTTGNLSAPPYPLPKPGRIEATMPFGTVSLTIEAA